MYLFIHHSLAPKIGIQWTLAEWIDLCSIFNIHNHIIQTIKIYNLTDQELTSKIYKKSIKLSIKKISSLILKTSEGPK